MVTLPVERPPLTARQREALQIVWDYYLRHRHYPTVREVGAAMGLSSRNGAIYVEPLVTKGYLERVAGKRRGLRFTPITLELMDEQQRQHHHAAHGVDPPGITAR